ncbi:MAG TPA: acyltransferase [Kiritimatiellia bacterium]|nr:acyltransferase [Kiritimatiellia bacterium]
MTLYTDFHLSISPGARVFLGSGYINSGLRLDCYESIRIGFSVAIGPEVIIRDSDNHSLDDKPLTAPVVIGDHVWIGARAMILKGVTIGDGAVIAAGAVVTRNIPPGALATGVPARVIREDVHWS